MKITLSPLVAALHGRAAGAVCAVTRGVQYVKKLGRPGGPPSAAQLAHRDQMSRMANLWRSLPDNIKAQLDVLGDRESMSGFALFTRVNARLHSPEYAPAILPGNGFVPNHLNMNCTPGMYPGDIDITWTIDPMPWWFHVNFFTTVKRKADITKEDGDRFMYWVEKIIRVDVKYVRLEGFRPEIEYWIVACVAWGKPPPDDAVFSGGAVQACFAGPPP